MRVVDPVALVKRLCGQPREVEWLEFKQNAFIPEKVGEYISALANSAMLHNQAHGYLVFGVENETHNILGTTVRMAKERMGGEPFLNWVVNRLDPKLTLEPVSFDCEGKHIEMLVVDPGYQRPVRFSQTSFIRVGQQTRKLDDFPDRARTLWQISSRFVFESGIAIPHVSPENIEQSFDLPALFKLLGKPKAPLGVALDYLLREGLVIDDLQGGYDVTNLLALACARDIGLYPTIATKAPRVVVYKGKSKQEASGDRTGKRGYAIAFPGLLNYLVDRTPFREEMKHGVRRTIYSYPEDAVRELLANALIHQDFTIDAGHPIIEIFDDRMQITNPGEPLVEVGRFIDTPSKTRNSKLASLMRRANLCEMRGSGVDKAIRALEADQLPPPLFKVADGSTVVTMFSEREFSKLSRDDRIRGCYQHACVKHEAGDAMSNGSLRIRFGLRTHPQASEVIADTIQAELIRPVHTDQGNRNAQYRPCWA